MSRRRMKRLMARCCILVIAVTIYRNWNSFLLILSIFPEWQEENFQWRDKSPLWVSENSFKHGVQKISSILDEMPVLYPSKIFTYTGWIQNLDVFYDSNQWSQKPLVVHVVPFSHNDPGWLSTYEEYFSSRTKYILDVAIFKLNLNSNMTFVWSEICYLKKWYEMISDADKKIFRRLLKEGRFEVLTGGMVMPDEAIVPYYSFINVLTQGHLWLKKEFNHSVDTSWSLDSFGHSSTYAHVLRLSGIRKAFVQRTHYALKQHLALKKQVEFYWVQPWEIASHNTGLFTHMSPFLFYSLLYSCGPNIHVCCQFVFFGKKCWKRGEYAPADKITPDNLREKSLALLDMLRKKAQFVTHDNVLLLVGDDFSFYSIYTWDIQWENMQKIFDYLNADPTFRIQIKYSTLGSYLDAAESEIDASNKKVPQFEGDFFPYSDRGDQYWSGYYSTRPKLKSLIRKSQSNLRNAELLFGLISSQHLSNQFPMLNDAVLQCQEELWKLQDDFSIYQHHDTITGTSRLEVIRDTENKLLDFRRSVGRFVDESVKLLQPPIDDKFFDLV